jgi:hypothetical protein
VIRTIVEEVTRTRTAGGCELSGVIRSPSKLGDERLHFSVPGGTPSWLAETGDAFLAALVMPAMALGEDLVVKAPVSRRLMRSARTVMEIYAAWWPELHPVAIEAADTRTTGLPTTAHEATAVGLFFTTGVDSFYSLLKDVGREADPGHEPVTHLVFANFEQQSGHDYEGFLGRIGHVAQGTRRRQVVVETNVRQLFDSTVSWLAYHGAALAAVALALQGLLRSCLIAASDQYRHLPPLGSHPVLDHLWSSEHLEIVHDGAEASRTDKIARHLATSRLALENLGVCWISKPGYNCGVCEKCLRTMVALELAGALGRCTTLPAWLDLDRLRTVPMYSEDCRDAMRSVVVDARNRGRHDIADAAEDGLRRYPSSGNGWPLGPP